VNERQDPSNVTRVALRTPWWLPGPHAQTVGGRYLRARPRLAVRRERIEAPDGDFLDIDLVEPPATGASTPRVMLLHGLEGRATSGYALATYTALQRLGVAAVGLNFRSCGGEPNRAERLYHAGETGDPRHLLEWMRARWPDAPLAAIGFSLGGNVLLKLLGEMGAEAAGSLRAAAAISVPFDLDAGARHLERGVSRFYARYFVRSLRRKLRRKPAWAEGRVDRERVRAARTFPEFDDCATAPLHGFRDVAHYYAESSSARYLPGVRLPTLLLQSRDDPFLPADALPLEAVRGNPWLRLELTDAGGHVGFITGGAPWRPDFWAEERAARFLYDHLIKTAPVAAEEVA
jgi:uncharacterized protein